MSALQMRDEKVCRYYAEFGILYELDYATPESIRGNFDNDYPRYRWGDDLDSLIDVTGKVRCRYVSIYNPAWVTFVWYYHRRYKDTQMTYIPQVYKQLEMSL